MIEMIVGIAGVPIGAMLAYLGLKGSIKTEKQSLIKEAESEAERIKKDKMIQAKERFVQLKSEHEKTILAKDKKINEAESRVQQKENTLNQHLGDTKKKEQRLDQLKENLNRQIEVNLKKEEELEKLLSKQVKQLESVSNISADDAKEQLKEALICEARTEAMSLIKEIQDEITYPGQVKITVIRETRAQAVAR